MTGGGIVPAAEFGLTVGSGLFKDPGELHLGRRNGDAGRRRVDVALEEAGGYAAPPGCKF